MIRLEEHHWALWAMMAREGGPNLGYPTKNVLWSPPRRGNVDRDDPGVLPTDDDWEAARHISTAIGPLRIHDAIRASALEEYYGAYAGAPKERHKRMARACKACNRGRSGTYAMVKAAKSWIEGAVCITT